MSRGPIAYLSGQVPLGCAPLFHLPPLTPIPGERHFPLLPLNFAANFMGCSERAQVPPWRGSRGTVAAVSEMLKSCKKMFVRAPLAGSGAWAHSNAVYGPRALQPPRPARARLQDFSAVQAKKRCGIMCRESVHYKPLLSGG